MSLSATALSEVATYTTNIYPPDAGTPILAADVEAGEQALANRTKYLASLPRVVEVVKYSATDPSEAHAQLGVDFTTNLFVDSTVVLATSTAAVKTNDLVHIAGQFVVARNTNGGFPGALRMRCGTSLYCDDSIPLVPASARHGADVGYVIDLHGTYVVSSTQNGLPITFTLQGRMGDTAIKVLRPSNFTATIYRTGL